MIKVMHIIHGLNTGGAETLIKEYALKLDKNKFNVILLCFEHHYDSPYESLLIKNGINIIFIEDYLKHESNSILGKYLNKIQKYFLVRKIIKNEKPDVIHTHLLVNQYIKFANLKKTTKVFYTMHGEPERYKEISFKNYKATKWLVKKYNMKIICLHNEMEEKVKEMYKTNNTIVLNNGIDIIKYKRVKSKNDMRKKLNIPIDSYIVGHIGRLNKIKNHKFLIEVFNNIRKHNNKAFLLMIGDGDEKNNISKQLSALKLDKYYKILSNRNDIPDLLNCMDVFVFPSFSEGLGISVIEAQEAKLPCFISNDVPDSAIISNLVSKISLNESSAKWANKILNYNIPKVVNIYDENWDINKVVKKLEKLYEGE